ncbi:MAG: flagellar protein FlgN [Methylococcaceae bacterium]|nr:flagellar protein FlgN [Methylococcaceae bacterium]
MINKTFPIVEKLLKNGFSLSIELLDILTKEAENLKSLPDANTISKLAANKREIVSQLDQFSKQLSQVLSTEKLQMTADGVSEYFKKAESAALITLDSNDLWKKIISITKQCSLLNEKNGASINILAQHTHRSLQILKGKSQHTATTYGPDGSAKSERLSNSLISV